MRRQVKLRRVRQTTQTTMRVIGTTLMLLGAFVMTAAAVSLLGMNVRANGVDVFANVTSVPGAFIGGAILVIGGAWLRRRARLRSPSRSAV